MTTEKQRMERELVEFMVNAARTRFDEQWQRQTKHNPTVSRRVVAQMVIDQMREKLALGVRQSRQDSDEETADAMEKFLGLEQFWFELRTVVEELNDG